jgi:uncharacterized protein
MSENKLHLEKSLYLKQHAENPIHWWPYGPDALEKARESKKLIFLSVGYSSCHWCHVMAHESFSDQPTADFLNEHFISIKVDREEYPDLDNYYQNVCSLMSGRGGWPLTIFLTPEAKPFIAGTYFPKTPRQGMPSFMEVLKHVQKLFSTGDKTIYENAHKITEELKKPHKLDKKIEYKGHFPAPSAIMNALKSYADSAHGGYGKAPKFPHFPFYEWACEQILEGMIPKEQGEHIVETIEKMMMGGIYDHLKGGIHRYSVDEKFLVPHFEKMLYDQAGLLRVLAKLSQFYPAPLIFDGILQTLDYLSTEMVAEEGYFFSAQDADSEGHEGLYFTFGKDEFEASFEEAAAEQKEKISTYLSYFNITEQGNFEHGLNVISLNPQFKSEFYSQEGWQEIRDIRRRLLNQRKMRIPPATDPKGVAGWNFMLLSALADVVQYCPIDVIQKQALNLIQQTTQGCLEQFIALDPITQKQIITHVNTLQNQALYAEDYIHFSDSQLRLYEISGNETFKKNALETMHFIIQNFVKDQQLYQTAINAPTLGFDNLLAPSFDQSYRSSTMTLLLLLNRLSVFDPQLSPEEIFGPQLEEYIQFTLNNPLGHGEGLRAMSYPRSIYRKIEVPLSWLEKAEFIEMRQHFFARFVLSYQNQDSESYQICTHQSCEAQGRGFEQFQALFKGQGRNNE